MIPLSPPEAMRLLCGARLRWRRKLPEILRENLFYMSIAGLGHELIDAVIAGKTCLARRVFQTIERCLTEGDEQTRNLIVVGMFESMQGDAYHRLEPPDVLDSWLGPASQKAWADLIEGWIGTGIRSIEHWRRVLVNGTSTKISWEDPERSWTIERLAAGARIDLRVGAVHSSRVLDKAESAAFFANFEPLIAERLLEPGGEATRLEYGVLKVQQPHQSRDVRIGERLGMARVASDGRRWFLLEVDAIAALAEGVAIA